MNRRQFFKKIGMAMGAAAVAPVAALAVEKQFANGGIISTPTYCIGETLRCCTIATHAITVGSPYTSFVVNLKDGKFTTSDSGVYTFNVTNEHNG